MWTSPENYTYTNFRQDIEILITPRYVAERSNPSLDYYAYQYKMTIHNHIEHSFRLKEKQWFLNGRRRPHNNNYFDEGLLTDKLFLAPKSSIELSCSCSFPEPYANLRGHLVLENKQGHCLKAPIPLFFFRPPIQ